MNYELRTNNYSKWFWFLNISTAILRLLIIGRIGLTGDEAHYWAYSRHPALSYFDHPPLIGYLIKLFTSIFSQSEFAVRLPAVLLFFVTNFLIYKLARKLFDDKVAFWSAALISVMPVFSFLGAVLTIPDAPLAFFWMAFVYIFWKIVENPPQSPFAKGGGVVISQNPPLEKGELKGDLKVVSNIKSLYWYVLGIILGFGLLSKYNAVFLVISVFMFLVLSEKHRFWLKRKEPYIALLISFIVFLPVVVWNIENSFASFGYQLYHGFGKKIPSFSPALLGRCLGAQAGYLSPVFFIIFWIVLFRLLLNFIKGRDEKSLFLFSFSFPILVVFNVISSFNEILPHWPAMGYLVLSIAVSDFTIKYWNKLPFKITIITAWFLAFILTILVPLQAIYKIIPPEILLPKAEASKIEDGITKAEKVDITNELYGWDEVGRKIEGIVEKYSGPNPFVFTHRHYIASQLSFYVRNNVPIYCLSERVDAYDFWQRDLSLLDGRDAVFVTNDYFFVEPEKIFPFAFFQKLEPIEIYRAGRKTRIFWITLCRKFDLKNLGDEYSANTAGSKLTLEQGLRRIDYEIFWFINKDLHFKAGDAVMSELTKVDVGLGMNTGFIFLAVLVGVILWFTKRDRFWQEYLLALGIIVFGGILVHILKDLAGRMRPLGIFGEHVNVFSEKLYKGSFPSGHSQIAFSVATYLSSRLKKYWWLFFSLALIVGLSRIYIGVHFPIDVIAGAVIGIVFTAIVLKFVRI